MCVAKTHHFKHNTNTELQLQLTLLFVQLLIMLLIFMVQSLLSLRKKMSICMSTQQKWLLKVTLKFDVFSSIDSSVFGELYLYLRLLED